MTNEEILEAVSRAREKMNFPCARELHVAPNLGLGWDPREQFNNQITEELKHRSRQSEDQNALASPTSSTGVDPRKPQSGLVSMTQPASLSSRISAIQACQSKTARGIKLMLSIQTTADAVQGEYVNVTAELKRQSRLRELKPYLPDDWEFSELFQKIRDGLQSLGPEAGKPYVMGRMHVRGARGHWLKNMMAVGELNTSDVLQSVCLYLGKEIIDISMAQDNLTTRQSEVYVCAGTYGQLRIVTQAQGLDDLPRRQFR